jgi:hypothetical protein
LKKWKVFDDNAAREPPFSKACVHRSAMFDLPRIFGGGMAHLMLAKSTEKVVGLAMLDEVEAVGAPTALH